MGNFMKDAVTANKFQETECISQIVPEGREKLLCRLKNEVDFILPPFTVRELHDFRKELLLKKLKK
jgi:hypothetical protein